MQTLEQFEEQFRRELKEIGLIAMAERIKVIWRVTQEQLDVLHPVDEPVFASDGAESAVDKPNSGT
jgi:hypothetical protein